MVEERDAAGQGHPSRASGLLQRSLIVPRTGSTLLLALVLMSALVATGLAMGSLVTRDSRRLRAFDDGLVASYAAESGVESFLHRVLRTGERIGLDEHRPLTNGAGWDRTVNDAVDTLRFVLSRDARERVDVVSGIGVSGSAPVRALRIVAPRPQPGAWLTATVIPWEPSSGWATPGEQLLVSASQLQGSTVGGVLVDLEANIAQAAPAYRLEFLASNADVGPLRIHAMGDRSGAQRVPYPEYLEADVMGSSGTARSAMRVGVVIAPPSITLAHVVRRTPCTVLRDDAIRCPGE